MGTKASASGCARAGGQAQAGKHGQASVSSEWHASVAVSSQGKAEDLSR